MSSPAKICMNGLCGATVTPQWKNGWTMKTGACATLCYACGTAYDNVNYCERFHLNEAGWRECNSCEKPVHCGCVVSVSQYECLDLGGILCITCAQAKGIQTIKQPTVKELPTGFARYSGNWHPSIFTNRTYNGTTFDNGNLTQLTEGLEKHQNTASTSLIMNQIRKLEETTTSSKEFTNCSSSNKDIMSSSFRNSPLPLSSFFTNSLPFPDTNKQKSIYEQSFGFNLGASSSSVVPKTNGVSEMKVHEKVPSFKQEQKPRQLVPKLSKSGGSIRAQVNKGVNSENRVGRPPGEGRGRNQLLPRYWPKITDQELLQISGDLNSDSTITPLFEKVLSASDAGRIGRLVLPKACAEAYFPPINQSEGLPIKIRDIKGKEWTFQFRFWPNNNSRMYVLEGVTPCIQNMQVQAGDTVIFSRLDPDDKLIIGCRKATVSTDASNAANGDLPTNMEHEGSSNMGQEKKKMRNIGSKNKRLHMHSEDAMELKLTWEEAQDFLRPPPSKPTVVVIDKCELEEYNEPPVFGKKTIFTTNASQLQEQWVQCDSCCKWRKLPSDVLVPSKWTCSDNVSDPNRCTCSAPEEKGVGELDRILRIGKESKKRKVTTAEEPQEPTGLDALATMAVLGANDDSLAGPTTKHPRHRPGCSCIVCIQPPSGKGKHKPNCICNVCATVRRRFKTLMLRKKKRLSEREGDMASTSQAPIVNENGLESSNKSQGLDLNCDPKEEEMLLAEAAAAAAAADANVSSIPPEWQRVLEELVPLGTCNVNKVVEGEGEGEGS